MPLVLVVDDRVVRCRRPEPGQRTPKARWVVHLPSCAYAPGCEPLSALVAKVGERGVLGRIRAGLIVRCVSCNPALVERIPE